MNDVIPVVENACDDFGVLDLGALGHGLSLISDDVGLEKVDELLEHVEIAQAIGVHDELAEASNTSSDALVKREEIGLKVGGVAGERVKVQAESRGGDGALGRGLAGATAGARRRGYEKPGGRVGLVG